MVGFRIRVRYSSILNYLAQMYRVFIALAFSIVVARKLPISEYGLWVTLMSTYSLLWTPSVIWRWWGSRFFARGVRGSAESVLMLNIWYSPVMALLMTIIGYAYSLRIGWGFEYFLVIALMIPLDMVNLYIMSMLAVTKPEVIGYSVIIYETFRLTYAFILVALLKLHLLGAVLSPILALLSTLIIYTVRVCIKCRVPLKPKADIQLIRKWLRGSYIPAISSVNALLLNLDKAVLTAVTGFTEASAFLGVASIPRSVILRGAGALSTGLYAKLLRVSSSRDIEDVIRITLLIGICEVSLLTVLARPVMSLLNPVYANAPYLLILMTFESFILMLAGIFSSVAIGVERADLVFKDTSKLIKTPLFKLPISYLVRNLLAIASATIATTYYLYLMIGRAKPQTLALTYVLAWLITAPPYLIYTYLWAKKKADFRFPIRELIAFCLAGISSALLLKSLHTDLIIIRHLWIDAPKLIVPSVLAIITYLAVAVILSPWLRSFIKSGLRYVGVIPSPEEHLTTT